MKGKLQKSTIQIGITVFLCILTILAVYGFGWLLTAEQNLLLAMAGLPENQKWYIEGNLEMANESLESPIQIGLQGDIHIGNEYRAMDSRWHLQDDFFGNVELFRLARTENSWFLMIPKLSQEEVWHLQDSGHLSKEDLLRWVEELDFKKLGYKQLPRDIGGNISCLHVQSNAEILPEKMMEWLTKLSKQDLPAEKKQELQELMANDFSAVIDGYITPDLKIMQLAVRLQLQGNFSTTLQLAGRPEKVAEPDLTDYKSKTQIEVDEKLVNKILSILQVWEQEVVR